MRRSLIRHTNVSKDTRKVMSSWKQFFENLLNIDMTTTNKNKVYQRAEEYVPEATLDEVERAINQLKNNMAPGNDSTAECIEHGREQLYNAILEILQVN